MRRRRLRERGDARESVMPANAGIQVPLAYLTEKIGIPAYTGMTKRLGGMMAKPCLGVQGLNSEKHNR